jgi:MFS family permease
VFSALTKWPKLRRPATLVGLLLMCIALAAASFATSVTHLIVTHGILYAIGGSICYSPTILFVNEWFIRRKGLAFGIMWAGTGVSGVVLPLVMQWLLHSYGFRTTLRIWSLALFILTFPLLHYLKPRLPIESTPRHRKMFDMSFLYSPTFLVLQICNICEALGFFLPTIYLPTFATDVLHTSPLTAAGTVILVNVASVFGCVAMGSLTDRFHVTTCILLSTLGATVGVFVLWGLSTSLPLLYVFCIVYGLFAGSFSSTWTGIIKIIQSRVEGADAGLVFAFLAFGRGVGNVVSGPLSEALIKGKPWLHSAGMAYGSGYGPIITFTGISALLGGCSFLVRGLGRNS